MLMEKPFAREIFEFGRTQLTPKYENTASSPDRGFHLLRSLGLFRPAIDPGMPIALEGRPPGDFVRARLNIGPNPLRLFARNFDR